MILHTELGPFWNPLWNRLVPIAKKHCEETAKTVNYTILLPVTAWGKTSTNLIRYRPGEIIATKQSMEQQQPFLYLAPIRGITDALFREILSSHFSGIDCGIAPFINPQKSSLFEDKTLRDVLPENNTHLPIIPQLLHTDPEPFLVLTKRLADLGYRHINWNLGCPAPMIAKKKRGSGLLPYSEKIIRILDHVMPRLDIELSIKTRLGFFEKNELFTLLPQLSQFPLKEIIIHTRLGKQLYKGATDPVSFAKCLTLSKHPLVYNGDIVDLRSFHALASQFPTTNRWMIGRGLLANPLLAEEIKAISGRGSRYERLYAFHQDLYVRYEEKLSGPGHLLGRLKLIWSYLFSSFPVSTSYFKKIQKSKTPARYRQAVDNLFEQTAS